MSLNSYTVSATAALDWIEEENEADVDEKVDRFFAELDLDQKRQRKRIQSEGVKVCSAGGPQHSVQREDVE